jgi:hypothetical protein
MYHAGEKEGDRGAGEVGIEMHPSPLRSTSTENICGSAAISIQVFMHVVMLEYTVHTHSLARNN